MVQLPSFVIRPAVPADVPLLLTMFRELADYEKLEVTATEALLHAALFGPRPFAEACIGEVSGEPAAYMVYYPIFRTFPARPGLYLEDLFVRPAFRGQGLGQKLLRHLAKIALGRGCDYMEWVVLDWNKPAIGFYESLGGKMMGEWRTFRLSGESLSRIAE